MEAVVLDRHGIPYSVERFLTEPQSAHEFLENMEKFSVGVLPNWRGYSEDLIIQEAQYHLYWVSKDLEAAQVLRASGRLQ